MTERERELEAALEAERQVAAAFQAQAESYNRMRVKAEAEASSYAERLATVELIASSSAEVAQRASLEFLGMFDEEQLVGDQAGDELPDRERADAYAEVIAEAAALLELGKVGEALAVLRGAAG